MAGAAAHAQETEYEFDLNGNLLQQTAARSGLPQLLSQPQPRLVSPGDTASFSVVVKDTRALAYAWQFNGVPLGGSATNDALLLPNVSAASEGEYRVVVTNPSGSVTSAPAQLRIDADADGLADSWELTHFGSLTNAASADADGDRVSNLQEFRDDTNPTSPSSARYRLHLLTDGTVAASPDQDSYASGEAVTLTAVSAPSGEPFHGWVGEIVSRSPTITLVMTNDVTLQARFSPLTFVWTNRADGDWSVAENWTPRLVPGFHDNVVIPGTVIVTLAADADCADVVLGGVAGNPTLTGSGTLTVRGQMAWHSGAMSGNGRTRIETGGSLTVISADGVSLSGRTLENGGTVAWLGSGNLNLFAGAVISNRAGALFHARNAAQLSVSGGSSLGRFDNDGTFLKSGDPGITATGIGIQFNNTGIVQIDSGRLDLEGGGDHGGSFSVSDAATLAWSGGTHHAGPSSRVIGAGHFIVSGATANLAGLVNVGGAYTFAGSLVNVTGDFTCAHAAMTISGGTVNFNGTGLVSPARLSLSGDLGGTNEVTVLESMTWMSGNLNQPGRLIIAPGAELQLMTPGNLNGRTLENAGTARWTGGGTLVMNPPALITNRAGGVFDIQNTAAFVANNGLCRIDNAGIFRKSVHPGAVTLPGSVALNNYGAVEIHRGVIVAQGGFASAPDARLQCTLGGLVPGTGYGQLQVVGGVTNNGTVGVIFSDGFSAHTNDVFAVVTANARVGGFSQLLYSADAYTLQLHYTPTSAVVRSTGPAFVTARQLPDAVRLVDYAQSVVVQEGVPPLTHELVSGALPVGLSLSPAGVIGGRPTVTGDNHFSLRIRDAAGALNQQTFSLHVVEPALAPAGLISWWRAEGNALDAAGGNHGTASNGVAYVAGKVGQAFGFDGLNDFVSIPDASNLRPTSITIEAWVMFGGEQGPVLGRSWGPGIHNSYIVWQFGGTLNGTIGDVSQGADILSAPFAPRAGEWRHVAFTFDEESGQQALYLDGAVLASGTTVRSIGFDAHPVLIGGDIDNGSVGFLLPGAVDEAALYDRALAAAEIASIYHAGTLGKQAATPYQQWKLTYLGAADAADTGDPDGDGFDNLSEYTADTNPTNALSNLHISSLALVPEGLSVEWQGGTLATQVLQRRLGLEPTAVWEDVFTNAPPTASPFNLTLPTDPSSAFYRLRVIR